MTAKEAVIKEAYKQLGVHWGIIAERVDCDGWIHDMHFTRDFLAVPMVLTDTLSTISCWRPKTLRGIDDNNGWINLQGEDTWPEAEKDVMWIRALVGPGEPPMIYSMITEGFPGIDYFTHWRPIPFDPPFY